VVKVLCYKPEGRGFEIRQVLGETGLFPAAYVKHLTEHYRPFSVKNHNNDTAL
jgi:hypothetical protein